MRVVEFETIDPALQGEMTFTITLADATAALTSSACTTACRAAFRPPTTSSAGGWLGKLAALVEAG